MRKKWIIIFSIKGMRYKRRKDKQGDKMKKKITNSKSIFPMPVLLVATYNEDNTVNVMNAAWGTMISRDQVLLILSKSRKTVENILKRNAFTISIPSSKYTTEADYFGVVSGNNIENKLAHANLTSTKSNNIDAPIINELPVSLECTFIKYHEDEYIEGVIAKVENIYADESVITNDKIDASLLKAITYNSYTNEYYEVSNKVGNAFKDGLKLK